MTLRTTGHDTSNSGHWGPATITRLWVSAAFGVAAWMAADAAGTPHRTVFALALPDDSVSCIAVAGPAAVSVQALDGRQLWQWSYAKGSRYIAPEAVAVSRGCDAVALVGDAGYKYTWVVEKSGRATPITAPGTPLSAAFDPSGRRLAIGTAAGRVVLVGPDARQLWTTNVGDHAPVVRDLRFTSNGGVAVTGGGAVLLDGSGRVVWGQHAAGSAPSRNGTATVVWDQPPHGPGYGMVQLVDLAGGKSLWQAPIHSDSPESLVSRDGSKVALWMNRNQDIDQDAAFEPDPPMDLCVLGTAGRIVRRMDVAKGRLIAGDASLDRVLLDAAAGIIEVSASGNTRIVVSRDAIGWDGVVRVAGDYSGLVVAQPGASGSIRWVSLQ